MLSLFDGVKPKADTSMRKKLWQHFAGGCTDGFETMNLLRISLHPTVQNVNINQMFPNMLYH